MYSLSYKKRGVPNAARAMNIFLQVRILKVPPEKLLDKET